MKSWLLARLTGIAFPTVYALAAVAQTTPLFSDAPPPQIAEKVAPDCCTSGGRFILVPAAAGKTRQEGEACEGKDANGQAVAGKVCY